MNSKKKLYLSLFFILLGGFLLRIFGLNWDQGYHLHPDERAIVLFTLPLRFPSTITSFFSASSSWNPHFFAYGSFPLYLLWVLSKLFNLFNPLMSDYGMINLLGRGISAFFDTGTIFLLYLLGRKLFSSRVGIGAALLYALCVLPIQLSHFYAVDTLLTFFITLTLLLLVSFYDHPTIRNAIGIGISIGLACATKISALPLIVPLFFTLTNDFVLTFLKTPHKPHHYLPLIGRTVKRCLLWGSGIAAIALTFFCIVEPYALIDNATFLMQNQQQSAMTKDAWVFPYTLQYVGKIPYVYELKNLVLWGMGPILGILCLIGIFSVIFRLYKREKSEKWAGEIILFTFFFPYFLIVGHFSVGFMRYMLPLYPLLCLFGASVIAQNTLQLPRTLRRCGILLLLFCMGLWTVSFLHIYGEPNTRVRASDWILQNIPAEKTIAIEHWDDGLPLDHAEYYHILTLPPYDPDSPEKWSGITTTLDRTDYIIVASNRLYVPLMKLTDCAKLAPHPCYSRTKDYYKKLFGGELGFHKVAEFSTNPTIPFVNIPINDQSADESFTVYDHPVVMIFQKDTSQ